jgi:hypothetical protein
MGREPIRPKNPGLEVQRADPAAGVRGKGKGRAQRAAQAPLPAANAPPKGAAESPAFHVLLERLSRSARELQENADAVERPSDLAGAVGRAKASLDDALSLGEELLEAWRAKQLNTNPGKSDR